MTSSRRGLRGALASACILLAGACSWACGTTHASQSAPATTSTLDPSTPSTSTPSSPLSAPATTSAQDAQYLTDVTEADPALATYEQSQGNVALRALLTDGSAFCAFLQRGEGIDDAMVSVGVGARGVESQTSLPLSVTTFNTIEAVALLTLCPSYQKLLPPADQSKIQDLGASLAQRSG